MRAQDILIATATGIAAASALPEGAQENELTNRVIRVFVDREVSKRADLLVKGVELVDKLQKEYDQINKPDQNFINADGSALLLTSQKRKQEIDSAKKKLDKTNEAVGQALNAANFEGLSKVLASGGKPETE